MSPIRLIEIPQIHVALCIEKKRAYHFEALRLRALDVSQKCFHQSDRRDPKAWSFYALDTSNLFNADVRSGITAPTGRDFHMMNTTKTTR